METKNRTSFALGKCNTPLLYCSITPNRVVSKKPLLSPLRVVVERGEIL
jgi:hypothetical protein